MHAAVEANCEGEVRDWATFAERLFYIRGDANSPPEADYAALLQALAEARHGVAAASSRWCRM